MFVDAGPGPGGVRGQPVNVNAPGSHQTPENMQQMKKRMEQELKSDKYKSNNNKGYVFTLMPLYAIGVGVFAAYKFLKVTTYSTKLHTHNLLVRHCKVCLFLFWFSVLSHRLSLLMTRHKRTKLQKEPKDQWKQVCIAFTHTIINVFFL